MFSSSVRRVALTAQQLPTASSIASKAPRAAASQSLSYRSHQRRHSSSKPSSPANGPKGLSEAQVPTRQAQSSKRTGKDVAAVSAVKEQDETMQNLPSVPSTNHISPTHIAASLFFSQHRPLSLTTSFPTSITDEAFATIFTPRVKTNVKPIDVISTLSSTVQNLESAVGGLKQASQSDQQAQWNAETDELRASINAESYRNQEAQHLDNPPLDTAMEFPGHILSGKYHPFNPPPPPQPINTAESLAVGADAAESQEPQRRTYTSLVTIEELTNEQGEVVWLVDSTPVGVNPPLPTRFLERMQIRQERSRERAVGNNTMLAISVKRQRKLKMKKHKYKKLMRRTRNLRRRLDRN